MRTRRIILSVSAALAAATLTTTWALASPGTVTGPHGQVDGSARTAGQTEEQPEQLSVQVEERYPHDTEAFTQGLELRDGVLYEGTGQYGQSELRKVEPETGEVIASEPLPDDTFGEGITLVGDKVWQLTWHGERAYLRDSETLAELDQVTYRGEGWGICSDTTANRLVMSDGSADLTFRDPQTFAERRSVTVTRSGEPVTNLNELECVAGEVWANVWYSDEILRIDPDSGEVLAVVDASGLLTEDEAQTADVLNGIAYDQASETFLITGKLWPWTFRVTFE